jgi:hypothetical protein
MDDRFRFEARKSAVATPTAARDPNQDITITDLAKQEE